MKPAAAPAIASLLAGLGALPACSLDDLTAGSGEGAAGSAGQGAGGAAGSALDCSGADLCATFAGDGVVDESAWTEIRIEGASSLYLEDDALRVEVLSGSSSTCNYADLVTDFAAPVTGVHVRFRMLREDDRGATFVTVGHGGSDPARYCTEILEYPSGIGAVDLHTQLPVGEPVRDLIDATGREVPVGTWTAVELEVVRSTTIGVRVRITVDGAITVLDREGCDLGDTARVTLGLYCMGSDALVRFDDLVVILDR